MGKEEFFRSRIKNNKFDQRIISKNKKGIGIFFLFKPRFPRKSSLKIRERNIHIYIYSFIHSYLIKHVRFHLVEKFPNPIFILFTFTVEKNFYNFQNCLPASELSRVSSPKVQRVFLPSPLKVAESQRHPVHGREERHGEKRSG